MSAVPNFLDFTINAVLRPTFIWKLLLTVEHCNLYIHTDFFIKIVPSLLNGIELPCLLDTASKFALFLVSGLKDEKLIKNKPTWKLKHANSRVLNISSKFHQN